MKIIYKENELMEYFALKNPELNEEQLIHHFDNFISDEDDNLFKTAIGYIDMDFNAMDNYMKQHLENRKIVFASVYGSINYGTDTNDSDLDVKIFVAPSIDDLINGVMVNYTAKIEGNDFEIKDIRLLTELLEKANPTYLESLLGKITWNNPEFHEFNKFISENRFMIADANKNNLINGIIGMMLQKQSAIEKNYPTEATNEGYQRKIKFGFDTKQLLHIHRLSFIAKELLINNKNILECYELESNFIAKLLNIKKNIPTITKDEALMQSNALISEIKSMEKKELTMNKNIILELKSFTNDMIKKNILNITE